jgi:hypothetical protein
MAMAIDAPRIASTAAAPLPDSPVTPDAERHGWTTHCESLLAPTLQGQDVRPLCDCLFDQLAAKLGTDGAMDFGPQVFLSPGAAANDVAAAARDAMEGCKAKLGL